MIEFSEVGTLFFTLLRTFLEERIGIFLPPPPPPPSSILYLSHFRFGGGGENQQQRNSGKCPKIKKRVPTFEIAIYHYSIGYLHFKCHRENDMLSFGTFRKCSPVLSNRICSMMTAKSSLLLCLSARTFCY